MQLPNRANEKGDPKNMGSTYPLFEFPLEKSEQSVSHDNLATLSPQLPSSENDAAKIQNYLNMHTGFNWEKTFEECGKRCQYYRENGEWHACMFAGGWGHHPAPGDKCLRRDEDFAKRVEEAQREARRDRLKHKRKGH